MDDSVFDDYGDASDFEPAAVCPILMFLGTICVEVWAQMLTLDNVESEAQSYEKGRSAQSCSNKEDDTIDLEGFR